MECYQCGANSSGIQKGRTVEEWFFSWEASEDTLGSMSAAESPPKQCLQELWDHGDTKETHRTRIFGARIAGVSQDRTARSQHAALVRKPQEWHFKLQKLKDRLGPSDLRKWGCWRFFGISPQLSIFRR